MRGIMADEHVGESLQALGKDIDTKKMKELMAAVAE